jgi:alkylation response protein AidB-like acyl-CoA dehydrogenase
MKAGRFLDTLLSPAAPPFVDSASELRACLTTLPSDDTVERAALGGRSAAGLGWAFAAGYHAALLRLLNTASPALFRGRLGSLAATEQGGGHPRAIQCALTQRSEEEGGGFRLEGDKAFVTLGAEADVLLVVARTGQDDHGRNRLRVVAIPRAREGVTLEPGNPLPFTSEIDHARLRLRDVHVAEDEVLPGDGYDVYLKPFRTIEDVHVMAAAVGWAVGHGLRIGWSRAWLTRAAATLACLRDLGRDDPSAPGTHVALAGALELVRSLLQEADWASAPEELRARWTRDRPLLDVATRVRQARLDAAWQALRGDEAHPGK